MISALILATNVLTAAGETVTFQVDGVTRTALVYRPTADVKGKLPVYFVFHGLGGNAQSAAKQFHIQDLDPTALVIYGQGLPTSGFNSGASGAESRIGGFGQRGGARQGFGQGASKLGGIGGKNSWQIMPKQFGDRDVHFVQSMIQWADQNGADSSRRFYVGHSNGSYFGWVVLQELGSQFTRFVGLNGPAAFPLKGVPAKPAFLTTGTDDKLVAESKVQQFADTLAKINGCGAGSGSPVKTYPGSNPVYLYDYLGGHMPPADAYKMAVKFCQTGRV